LFIDHDDLIPILFIFISLARNVSNNAGFLQLNIYWYAYPFRSICYSKSSHNIFINIGIGEIKRSRVDLIYQATNQETNKEVARALTTLTFYDFQNATIVRIPPKFLSFLEG
jgi:hypothetical protein